ncbi:MAG: hypothetical protein JWP52_3582, partial [Rhizobacter sp.]|nr:hypothetical protein [Rhizobacter sp.]
MLLRQRSVGNQAVLRLVRQGLHKPVARKAGTATPPKAAQVGEQAHVQDRAEAAAPLALAPSPLAQRASPAAGISAVPKRAANGP